MIIGVLAARCARLRRFLRDVGGESKLTAGASGLGGGPDRCRLVGHGKLPILVSVILGGSAHLIIALDQRSGLIVLPDMADKIILSG
jgi:hypothetical protein